MEYAIKLKARALVVLNNIYRSETKSVEYEREPDFNEWANGFCLSSSQLHDTLRNDLYGIIGVLETRAYEGSEFVARCKGPRKQGDGAWREYYDRKKREIQKRGNEVSNDMKGGIYELKPRKCVKHIGVFIPEQNIVPVRKALATSRFKKDVPEDSLDVLQYVLDYTTKLKEKWPRYTVKFHPTGVAKDMYHRAKKEDVTAEEKLAAEAKLRSLTGLLNEMVENMHISRWSLPTCNITTVRDILYEHNASKVRRLLQQKRDEEYDNKHIGNIPQSLLVAC